jgi:hypothetical protein
MVLIHWQLHANTALCSGVASGALLLCVYPLCFCHSAAASSAQKEIKLVKCDRKDEIFSGAARQERRPLWASAPSEKKGTFQ